MRRGITVYLLVFSGLVGSIATADSKLFIYPTGNQTEEQLAEDRYECHVWAD